MLPGIDQALFLDECYAIDGVMSYGSNMRGDLENSLFSVGILAVTVLIAIEGGLNLQSNHLSGEANNMRIRDQMGWAT